MLGFGDKGHQVDPTKLPILLHVVQSAEAFAVAEKIWQTNGRNMLLDAQNHKELLRFVFANPACVAWLQRDQGRTDTFELILMWDNKETDDITEVYVLGNNPTPVGDASRAAGLLQAMLASPATVPVNGGVAPGAA
jgi:hypothetical protein